MAMNFTKSSMLGQSPDMETATLQEAVSTYQNIAAILAKARGQSDVYVKEGALQEAQPLINEAESHYSPEIKNHPQVDHLRKVINQLVADLTRAIESFVRTQIQYNEMRLKAGEAPQQETETPPPDTGDEEIQPDRKFPILPVAIAGGALALALMMGG